MSREYPESFPSPLPTQHRHETFVSNAVGDSRLSSMSPGFPIRGIRIDNYSGSWLTIRAGPYTYYLAPYVFNWQTQLTPSAINVTVEYSAAPNPSLPVSTTEGQPARVDLFEDLVLPFPGVPFLTFTGANTEDTGLIAYDANVLTVGTVAIAIPTVYPGTRRALLLQSALTNTDTIYIGGPTVTADTGPKGGIEMIPGASYPMDITSLAIPYAISNTASHRFIASSRSSTDFP